MQLTHGMDCPPGADSTAAAVPLPLQVHAVSTNVADAVQQVDLLVSANTSQADVRVAVPVANTLAVVNTQQLSAAAVPPMMGNVWHSKPMSSFPVAAATPILKRQCSLSGHRSVARLASEWSSRKR